MAKVVLNSVRLLSMEELCSLALAKRTLTLEPELAKSLGLNNLPSAVVAASSAPGAGNVPRHRCSRDLLVGRMICCALLQKALRWRPRPNRTLIEKLLTALNGNSVAVTLAIDSVRLCDSANDNAASSGVLRTLANAAQLQELGPGEEVLANIASDLGLSADECATLCGGQTEVFATASVLGLQLRALSKLSDCVVGLVCESLRVPVQSILTPELQKLPHCIGVARNLIWLTEDSKLIPSSSKCDSSLEAVVTGYVLANGELEHLSKSVVKITTEMMSATCGLATGTAAQGIAERAWSLALQSHVSGLCRCLAALAAYYTALLSQLASTFRQSIYEADGATVIAGLEPLLNSREAEASASEYERMAQGFATATAGLESAPATLATLDSIANVCGEATVACAALACNILSVQERLRGTPAEGNRQGADAGARRLVLGHGNQGVSHFLSEIMARENDACIARSFDVLHEALAGPSLLHHASRIDVLLVPRNQQARKLKVPKGTVDILPDEMLVRTIVLDAVRSVFKQHGACEIDTPVFELRETLMGKYGEDQKLIFDLKDSGGEQLSLRYDLTVPFARFLASNKIEKMKRFHIGKVYRRDEPQINRGRFREFVQCDLDYAGVYPPMVADAEVMFILIRILRLLCPGGFLVKIGHRVILDAIMSHCGVPAEMHRTICSSIDKLDKEPWSNVRDEMVCEKGLSESVVGALKDFVEVKGPIPEVVAFLRTKGIAGASEAVEEMLLLDEYLTAFGVPPGELSFDLSLARGLDYYTGVIFEAVLTGASVGSVGAGGRYDGLIGMLSGRHVPSVGMSVGIERLMKVVSHGEISSDITDVFVCTVGDASMLPERLRLCSMLWSGGITAEFNYNPRANLRKQLDTATAKRAQLAVVVGMSEISAGTVRVKTLSYAREGASDGPADEKAEEKVEDVCVDRSDMVHTIRRMLEEHGGRYRQLAKRVIPGMP
ncbi:histidyl-tRNA synthetase, putative [Babesia caballi]|uniref:histidine--tRNA ligase n=1 Tax=Babesia caballi TaxID=5871 RepID=A0AAV4M0X3_BABCB|nr:histidyl-tRNA synthetase, putative [Babesia caballi]